MELTKEDAEAFMAMAVFAYSEGVYTLPEWPQIERLIKRVKQEYSIDAFPWFAPHAFEGAL